MNGKREQCSWLALLPILATLSFYGLPRSAQQYSIVQFFPQILAYLGIGIWARYNTHRLQRFALTTNRPWAGIGWGGLTGLTLGICNTLVILWVVPALGGDIAFLKQTPHSQVPTLILVPWGILFIALVVEVNFRGFLLGRLAALLDIQKSPSRSLEQKGLSPGLVAAIGTSSLVFAFDPFMVTTFRHLHWIAVWDGLIWGWMRARLQNLYAVIMAHTLEVIILYLSVKAALT